MTFIESLGVFDLFIELLSPRGDPFRICQFRSLVYLGDKVLPALCDVLAGRLDSSSQSDGDEKGFSQHQKYLDRLLILESTLIEELENNESTPKEEISLDYYEKTLLLVKKVDPKFSNKSLSLGIVKLLSNIFNCSRGYSWLKRKILSHADIFLDIMLKNQRRRNLVYSMGLEILKIHYKEHDFYFPLKKEFGEKIEELQKKEPLLIFFENTRQQNTQKSFEFQFDNSIEADEEDMQNLTNSMIFQERQDLRRESEKDFWEMENFEKGYGLGLESRERVDDYEKNFDDNSDSDSKSNSSSNSNPNLTRKREASLNSLNNSDSDENELDELNNEEENEAKNSLKVLLANMRIKKTMNETEEVKTKFTDLETGVFNDDTTSDIPEVFNIIKNHENNRNDNQNQENEKIDNPLTIKFSKSSEEKIKEAPNSSFEIKLQKSPETNGEISLANNQNRENNELNKRSSPEKAMMEENNTNEENNDEKIKKKLKIQ